MPDNVDAIYLGRAARFDQLPQQYQQAGGKANLIGGTSCRLDRAEFQGKAKDPSSVTPTSARSLPTNPAPEWQATSRNIRTLPADKRFPIPSLFGVGYHVATLAMISALNEVKGDLSDGQKKFHAALSKLKLQTPLGVVTLNENRQASGSVFITEVSDKGDGTLTNKMVGRVDNVTQTLGMTADAFRAMGLPSRTTPDCGARGK